ncbi:MAG: hypothetical protein GX561_01395 [Lentisphaerae bacterium]|jgi:hypothetical protein|nr:hypothetical protein [Lentisphaerota bacterium]
MKQDISDYTMKKGDCQSRQKEIPHAKSKQKQGMATLARHLWREWLFFGCFEV